MRVALVHDWLTGMRGGERLLEVLIDIYPTADVFTLFWVKGSVSPKIEARVRGTSFLQRMPLLEKVYRYYLPLYPLAVERLDLLDYDLVISVSHAAAMGVLTREDARHVNYCLTPMRYLYGPFETHFGPNGGKLRRAAMETVFVGLRQWEYHAAQRADQVLAISGHVRKRIAKRWRREADIVTPPVPQLFLDTPLSSAPRQDYYLIVSALVPYKRVEVAIEAFRRNGRRLVIVGKGPMLEAFRAIAPPNVELHGAVDDTEVIRQYQCCRALIFPGEEDFGLTPLEAQACGAPVIALGQGGAKEVVHPKLGEFFLHPAAEVLNAAIASFEDREDAPQEELRVFAEGFSVERFKGRWREAAGEASISPS